MILHEKWEDYTEKELNKIKEERCKHCKYMSTGNRSKNGALSLRYVVCMYLAETRERRGVRPEECEHYKE